MERGSDICRCKISWMGVVSSVLPVAMTTSGMMSSFREGADSACRLAKGVWSSSLLLYSEKERVRAVSPELSVDCCSGIPTSDPSGTMTSDPSACTRLATVKVMVPETRSLGSRLWRSKVNDLRKTII